MPPSHWGFTTRPFQKDTGVSELFMSPPLIELAARLQVMVDQRLFGVVTGDIGAGKSSAMRYLAAQLDPHRHPFCYLADSHLTPYDFYQTVLDAWGVAAPFHRPQARRQFVTLMTDLYHHQHQAPVLIIDEAQSLPGVMVQELRYVLLCRILSYAELSTQTAPRGQLRPQVLGITRVTPARCRIASRSR